MTVRLANSVFVHVPRTGGMWLREVARSLGLDRQILHGDLDSHLAYQDLPKEWDVHRLKPFSFIRHPMLWARSRWTHAMELQVHTNGRHFGIHGVFDRCVRMTFAATLRCILRNEPGLVSRTFLHMTRGIPEENLICTIDLPDAAHRLLVRLEGVQQAHLATVRDVKKTNSTATHEQWLTNLQEVPPGLVSEFLDSEKELLDLWASRLNDPSKAKAGVP